MSYEGKMLEELKMPTRKDVEISLLKTLFRHQGVIKEFSSQQEVVNEIATEFNLNEEQRTATLQTIYRKENRIKRSLLWHRLLFRAARSLSQQKLVSNPTSTLQITNKKEWMLTEKGVDEVLKILDIPTIQKEFLPIKSFEIQTIANEITKTPRPKYYNPFDNAKKTVTFTKELLLRSRGFRQAVIEAYDFRCAFCGLKINTPNALSWEVQAAHIVPHSSKGKDDIWNGLALCRLHHWAFDSGWFTLTDGLAIKVSERINYIPDDYGRMGSYNFLKVFSSKVFKIIPPKKKDFYPHEKAISWHRKNVFF